MLHKFILFLVSTVRYRVDSVAAQLAQTLIALFLNAIGNTIKARSKFNDDYFNYT